jgi:DNA-binding response OmpR family regulator
MTFESGKVSPNVLREEALKAGATSILDKPVGIFELTAEINRVLNDE